MPSSKNKKEKITICNVPEYVSKYKYVLARFVENEWWYYTATNSIQEAYSSALKEECQVFHYDEIFAVPF